MTAIDTNVAVAINNGQPHVVAWARVQSIIYLPTPVLGELLYGAANSKNAAANRQQVDRLRAACRVVAVDEQAAELYASTRLGLKAIGRPIPENDVWIAAICLRHGFELATMDGHFRYVSGLSIVQP